MYRDEIEVNQLSFQDCASPLFEALVFFNYKLMCVLLIILVLVSWIILSTIFNMFYFKYLADGISTDWVLILIPALVLLGLAIPSMQLLHEMAEIEIVEPIFTIKATEQQWYWTYEYSCIEPEYIEFDSYLMPTYDLITSDLKVLEIHPRVIIPINTRVRIVVTNADITHAFASPSLGVKVDAISGRLNQIDFLIKRAGVYYGQSSKICGDNYFFMPIVIEGVPQAKFISWVCNHSAEVL